MFDSTQKMQVATLACLDGNTSERSYPITHNPHCTVYENPTVPDIEDLFDCIAAAQEVGIQIPYDISTAALNID